jgi:predicted chitinase
MKADIQDINIEASKRITIASNSGLGTSSIDVIRHLEDSMDKFKIFNKFARIAILSVVWKESRFKIKSETPYSNTPNDRIRMIFGSRLSSMSENRLTEIKADPEAFFNRVYGNMYGNGPDDGFKYRGRGLNQLTFKRNYQAIEKVVDENDHNSYVNIVNCPDSLLDDGSVAAMCCVAYFVNRFKDVCTFEFNDIAYATLMVFRANAGWGKNISGDFHQKTLLKVRNYAQFFSYETI